MKGWKQMELVALPSIGNLTHLGFAVAFCLHTLNTASSWRAIIWQGNHGASLSHFHFCYLSFVLLQGRSVEGRSCGLMLLWVSSAGWEWLKCSWSTKYTRFLHDPTRILITCLLPSYFCGALWAAQPLFKSFWRPSSKLVRIKTRRKYTVAPKRSLWPVPLHGPSYTNVT